MPIDSTKLALAMILRALTNPNFPKFEDKVWIEAMLKLADQLDLEGYTPERK